MIRISGARITLRGVVLATFLAGGVSCGAPEAIPPATHTITIEGSSFSPVAVDVKVGDAVTWVNKDFFPHTATSKAGGFDSQGLPPGRTWSYVAIRAGDIKYICTFHPTMEGTLRIR